MRLRRPIARAALAALAAALTCGASAAASSPGRAGRAACGPAGATTWAASSIARVFVSGGEVFGCSVARGGSIQLGQTQSCLGRPQIGPVRVRGEIAAYGLRRCGVDTGQGSIVVRRLDTRRILHQAAAVQAAAGPESYSQVASLVLGRGGSVAWIGTSHSIVSQGGGATEVHAIDTVGNRLLDSGSGVAPESLRLRGARVTWRHGTATRSAILR